MTQLFQPAVSQPAAPPSFLQRVRDLLSRPHRQAAPELVRELAQDQAEVMLGRVVVLIWISLFVMPTCCLTYTYFAAPAKFGRVAWLVAAACGAVLLLRLIIAAGVFRGREQLAMLVLVGGVFGPTGAAITEITMAVAGDFFFSFFLIYFAFTALFPADLRWILATSAALVASYLGAKAWRPGPFSFDYDTTANALYLLELTFIGCVLNRVVCRLFFDERRARIELRAARDALFAEMAVAQQIQTLLLPKNPRLPGGQVHGLMVPADEVGGDYYDVIESDGGRTLLAIGDVSGHGVTSGITMMMARSSLLGALQASPDAPLPTLYRLLNRCLRQNLARMDLKLYMTFALLECDGDGRFRAVGAHLPLLVYRARTGAVEEIDLQGMWLGVLDDLPQALTPEAAFTLEPGDFLFLYTDGVVEHSEGRDMFGWTRLKTTIESSVRLGARGVVDAVLHELRVHSTRQADDMTMLVVSHTGAPVARA